MNRLIKWFYYRFICSCPEAVGYGTHAVCGRVAFPPKEDK